MVFGIFILSFLFMPINFAYGQCGDKEAYKFLGVRFDDNIFDSRYISLEGNGDFLSGGFIDTTRYTRGKDSTNRIAFKRNRVYVGVGDPYLINLGFRYRLSKSWFVEMESPTFPLPMAFAFGASTKRYVNPSNFIFFDVEAKIVAGYDLLPYHRFTSLSFFSPSPRFGVGLVGGLDIGTKVDFLLYLRLGIIYQSGYGTPYVQYGLGWNF